MTDIFDDELILRPIYDHSAAATSENTNKFIDLVESYYQVDIFSTTSNPFEYIKSSGDIDEILLDANTNLSMNGVADITVNGGIQNIFDLNSNFSIEQLKGKTNLYINDLEKVDGEINLNSGTFNLLIENSLDRTPIFQIEDNYLHIDDAKINLVINSSSNNDAKLFIYSLNQSEIEITKLDTAPLSITESTGDKDFINTPTSEMSPSRMIEENSAVPLDEFIFDEPDVIIKAPKKMQIQMDQKAFEDMADFIDIEDNDLEKFIENVRAELDSDLSAERDPGIPIADDVKIEDLTTISDYEDFVFEDAFEIME